MSVDQPNPLPEADFSKMVAAALSAHGIEGHLRGILERASGTNGNRPSLISLPNGPPVKLNVPSAQDLGLMALNAALVQLQTLRIILVALNDLDSRLRLQQAGTIKPSDKQDTPDSGKVGDERGSQSPEAEHAFCCGWCSYAEGWDAFRTHLNVEHGIHTSGGPTSQGSKPSRPTEMVDGNPLGKAKV